MKQILTICMMLISLASYSQDTLCVMICLDEVINFDYETSEIIDRFDHDGDYEIKVNENPMENYKHFFNRSYVDSIDVINETLIFQKKWAEPIKFEILDFGTKEQIGKTIKESYNSNSFAEVIFLTKYIGDYDIHKYGEKFLIDEKDHTLVLKRQ